MDLGKGSLLANALAVPSQTTVWTNVFRMGMSKNFSIFYQCLTATSPSVRIQLEGSFQDPANPKFSFTQGASSVYYVVPDAFADIASNVVDQNWHLKGYQPPYIMYARFKLTGLAANPADTTITIYNLVQELSRTFGA